MATNLDDGFTAYWKEETDWLVDVVMVSDDEPKHSEINLNYIGRLFAFALATDTRMLAQLGDPEMNAYELWFSFRDGQSKTEFLNLVREDGYANPDDEACFDPPVSMTDLEDLRPIAYVFPEAQAEHIQLVSLATMRAMGIDPNEMN
ncbi:hypothetical protein [Occallatibacter savannae]|uniref:hypothetical protein n=1 Tax=Occallatibacter savannae TaxID=1002691 RepID=UPI000D691452|nr:hypothetical protein [Occallatibacter savannae]